MRYRTAVIAAIALLAVSAAPVLAWTQLINNYPNTPQTCNGQPPNVCVRWPKTANNLSITVWVYLDPSLANANLNLKPDLRDAMERWNDQPARNPFLEETSTSPFSDVWVLRGATNSFCGGVKWACTQLTINSSTDRIVEADMRFNQSVTWNHSLYYQTYEADSRKVSTHEFGHVHGLGHTGFANAVMIEGQASFFGVKPNDLDGLQAIYGAYP